MLRNFMKHVKTVSSILQKVSHMVFNVTSSLKLLFHTVQKVSLKLISLHTVFKIMNSTLLLVIMKEKYKISKTAPLTFCLKFTVYMIKFSGKYFEHTDADNESSGIIIISGLMFLYPIEMFCYLQICKSKVVHVL
jgi:hypothetical protein